MRNFFIVLCTVSMVLSSVGCIKQRARVYPQAHNVIYTYGDASYDRQLQEGKVPMKWGAIPAEHIGSNFPTKFLELDGSYGGGRVYRTVEAAERAVREAEDNRILSKGEAWGIYEVEGEWEANTYELHPNDFRLRVSAPIIRRVR